MSFVLWSMTIVEHCPQLLIYKTSEFVSTGFVITIITSLKSPEALPRPALVLIHRPYVPPASRESKVADHPIRTLFLPPRARLGGLDNQPP
jgi:hypothetical protein